MYNNLVSSTSYKVGIYIRLSQEDSDKKYESDNESVVNQRNILTSYLKANNYILTEEYIDDGYSGTNFYRFKFHKLIEYFKRKN
ncbi:MAG: recombinase family protein [Bacilli bacterium]|nr:recombinase family protein [Bacilli bacterium]